MRRLLALIVQFASFAAMAQGTVHFPSFDAGDRPEARAGSCQRVQGFLARHIPLH
ncbi:MAG: hypothetical protein JSS04_21095 [Proteobacteria bacterium]|nr:hypothetical protein [Pseudomonadota bacterium]